MKRLIVCAALSLILGACGPDTGDLEAEGPDQVSSTTEPPAITDVETLKAARSKWEANRPETYEFTYTMICECDQGPWTVRVDLGGVVRVTNATDDAATIAPYDSIEAIFADIDRTIEVGKFPVSVTYDPGLGYPNRYIFNEPELPVDGGFIFEMNNFVADPGPDTAFEREAYEAALDRWQAAGAANYDYTFTRTCFCPIEFVGPHKVSVRDGVVTAATFEGTDLLELDALSIDSYDEIVETVDGVFGEINRALGEADRLTVKYDLKLGYPTEVSIDWDLMMADEEVSYTISDLVMRSGAERGECSTTGLDLTLNPQPDLPPGVAAKRQQIFDAAMACDIEALKALTGPDGFVASFGGGDPVTLWTDAEAGGEGVLLDLVRHLNFAYAMPGEEGLYIWPSGFIELQSADGQGLSDEDFAELLTLYTQEELDGMFDAIGGYVGYRIGMQSDGTWIYFVAGD